MSSAHYRLLSPGGEASEEGSADAVVADGAFVLTPSAGDVLRVPFSQIAAVAESEPFMLQVTLTQGTVIELSRLGVMRTQLLAELRDAHADTAAKSAAVVGEADSFTAFSEGQQVELRIYDDALLIIGPAGSERISFCFVQDVQNVNYVVTIQVSGRDPAELTRLGNRTGEFTDALRDRLGTARGRTSAFLGSLLPGLDAMALRQTAGLLRDGLAAPAAKLNSINPELTGTLISLATLPERRPAIADLERRTQLSIGFRQIASVHKAAEGVTAWQDHSVTPHIGQHDSPGGSFRPGFAGMMAAGLMSGGFGGAGFGPGGSGSGGFNAGGFGGGGYGPGGFGPGGYGYGGGYGQFGFGEGYGAYGDYWAYRALGAGLNSPQQHQMTQRADMTRGRLVPASEDLSALTATGNDPTVMAFVLASTADRVIFEILNLAEPATLVFRASGPEGVAAINRALVDTGFSEPPAPDAGLATPPGPASQSAVLSGQLVGQVPHDGNWSGQISALLSG